MLWEINSTIGLAAAQDMRPLLPRWSYAPYYSYPDDLWADEIPGDAVEAETMSDVIQRIAPRHRGYLQDLSLWRDEWERIISYMEPSPLARTVIGQTNPRFFSVPNMDRVGIHIRRGDAITAGPKLYPLQSPMYVERALEVLRPKSPDCVFVFTDDATWCRMNLAFTGGHVVTGNADWGDQHLMAMCGGGLAIANSSFSYWAGIRNTVAKVCYPNTWYGPGFHDLSHKPMIPDGWTGIDDPKAGSKSCV